MLGVPGYLVVSLGNKMDTEEMLSPTPPPLRTVVSTLTFFLSVGSRFPLDAESSGAEGGVSGSF